MENRYDIPQSQYVYYNAECFDGEKYLFKTIKCHKSKVNQIPLNFFPNNFDSFRLEKIKGFVLLSKDLIKDPDPDNKYYKNSGKYIVPLEHYRDDVLIID